MTMYNAILKELRNMPADRLEDLYAFMQSLQQNAASDIKNREEILSFASCFSDMFDEDFKDFQEQTEQTRRKLFDRTIHL